VRSAIDELWPRVAAVGGLVVVWWGVYRLQVFDQVSLPSPGQTWDSLREHVADGSIPKALQQSLIRLSVAFAVAIVTGTFVGLLMSASSFVERSVGSLIIGLQSLPSIAWLPLAILWFGLSERAVAFVVYIGAFPAVVLGTTTALRQVPPLLTRAGRTLGARGTRLYTRVILPAALPGYVGGLQQGWAFAWRALMAGELLITGAGFGLGQSMNIAQNNIDTPLVLAIMVVIVIVGMAVDLLVFGAFDRRIRSKRGLAMTWERTALRTANRGIRAAI
jgi:NitT/TauT family transport system permease protein